MKNAAVLIVAGLLLSGCAHKKHSRRVPATPPRGGRASTPSPPPVPVPVGYTETGVASWYGYPYHGRQAADGEIYDMEKLVAAHRTLPFDTWVRVYDLDTDKTIDVRIIDRGPFVDGRIIDLSRAAARAIDMIGPGTARVRMEVIRAPEGLPPALYVVQVGAFQDRTNAEKVRLDMESRYGSARVMERPENPGVWRVMVGAESSQDAANDLMRRIRRESGENHSFVVRLDGELKTEPQPDHLLF